MCTYRMYINIILYVRFLSRYLVIVPTDMGLKTLPFSFKHIYGMEAICRLRSSFFVSIFSI